MSRIYHLVFDNKTWWTHKQDPKKAGPCGCIQRGDEEYLRYCHDHNTKVGTHGNRRR